MKLNRISVVVTVGVLFFIALFILLSIGSKDSYKHQLTRRLAAFKAVLPKDKQADFDNGQTASVTAYLQNKLDSYKAFTNQITPERRLDFVKADYTKIDKTQIEKVPKDLLAFYAKYYAVLDFECIQGFSVPDTVDFFKKYFADNLDKMKKGQVVPDQN